MTQFGENFRFDTTLNLPQVLKKILNMNSRILFFLCYVFIQLVILECEG